MKLRPINEAPMDGTVILTDRGCAQYDSQWRSRYDDHRGSWVCCSPDGSVFSCADDGEYTCGPKTWTPLPKWMQ